MRKPLTSPPPAYGIGREIPGAEKGLPPVLAEARAGVTTLLQRPSIAWAGARIKAMYTQRLSACERILTALVERTQLGLGGFAFEVYRPLDGTLTYRPVNVSDLLRLTGLSRASFYRAWQELVGLGLVQATEQEKKMIAPGEFRVGDVLRGLTPKFWHLVGVGFEAFKRACESLSFKAQQLLKQGKSALQRFKKRVFSSPAQAAAAKSQEDLSKQRRSLAQEAVACWREKEARGEDPKKCFGFSCKKACKAHCQQCLDEQRAEAAAGQLGYRKAGALALQQKAEADSLRVARIQLGLF